MLRVARSSNVVVKRAVRKLSSKSGGGNVLEGDAGSLATHFHHKLTTSLVVAAPLVFCVPDSWSGGFLYKALEVSVAVGVAAHSWIGLNYVATDYVPKISKSLVGPARFVNVGIGLVTMLGLGSMAMNDKGGIKGAIKGLWNPKKKEEKSE